MPSPFLYRFAQLLSGATLFLIAAGGLVTSTGSGLSVPDWPLSYGTFFPPMVGGIRFEHSHRVIAGTVGLVTLCFAIAVFKIENRAWVKRLAGLAVGAVVLQAVLGGLTVQYLLPLAVSVSHACLGQSFFALTVALAYVLSPEWGRAAHVAAIERAAVRRLSAATFGLVFGQLVAGAYLRHSHGQGLAIHYTGAFLVLVHAFLVHFKIKKESALAGLLSAHSFGLIAVSLFQIALGFGSFYYRIVREPALVRPDVQVLLTTAHQTTGAVLLALTLLLMLRVFRATRPDGR